MRAGRGVTGRCGHEGDQAAGAGWARRRGRGRRALAVGRTRIDLHRIAPAEPAAVAEPLQPVVPRPASAPTGPPRRHRRPLPDRPASGGGRDLPRVKTEIWGYEGRFPGPPIHSVRGRRTVVSHRNDLPVPTVVHLHGGHTPAGDDGFPTDLVAPGDSRDYAYPLRQPAATGPAARFG
ncbi:multicopper oxidase domain-containing protein [Actinoplanes sp. NPDC051470]|uniref:multicopper oxidase domain-containing protein n=1 Tax=Actinoplanes sp. NPDC051470 TaxID=3157224 RepID=UPI0034332F13